MASMLTVHSLSIMPCLLLLQEDADSASARSAYDMASLMSMPAVPEAVHSAASHTAETVHLAASHAVKQVYSAPSHACIYL